jgi:hypothetical protein
MIISGRLQTEDWGAEGVMPPKLVMAFDSVRFIGQEEPLRNPPASTDNSSIAPTDEKHDDAPQH